MLTSIAPSAFLTTPRFPPLPRLSHLWLLSNLYSRLCNDFQTPRSWFFARNVQRSCFVQGHHSGQASNVSPAPSSKLWSGTQPQYCIRMKNAAESAPSACIPASCTLKCSRCTRNSSYKSKTTEHISTRYVCSLNAASAADHPDYILQLRAQIKPVVSTSPLDDRHYLDIVAYWKEHCKQLQERCNDLQIENSRLERSNHSLTKHTTCVPESSPGSVTNASKQKARGASPIRIARRRKGDQQAERSVAETQNEIDDDMDFLDGLGEGKFLIASSSYSMLTNGVRGDSSNRGAVHDAQAMSNYIAQR